MAEWEETLRHVNSGSHPDRLRGLLDALDQADAVNATDASFDIRIDIIHTAYRVGAPMPAMSAFAWCRARMDDDPDRFARHQWSLDWCHKWMPTWAMDFPAVGAARLEAMIDDLERRHVEAGNGRRQALAVRLELRREAGLGRPLDELLAEWRTSARSSVTDCPACEVLTEAEALEGLGDDDGALAVLEPTITGSTMFCGDGPEAICAMAVPMLITAGRDDDAARMFRTGLRNATRDPRKMHSLAVLAAVAVRAGEIDRVRRLVTKTLGMLDDVPSPAAEMWAASGLSTALRRMAPDADLDVSVDVPRTLGRVRTAATWQAGDLAAALGARARELATTFDARNGNDVASTAIERLLAGPDLAPVALFRVPAVRPAPTGAAPSTTRPTGDAAGAVDDSGDQEPPTPSAPATDGERVDRARGLVTRAEQEPSPTDALPLLRQAVDAVRDLHPTPELAEARRTMGDRLRSAGRLDEATYQYAEAAELYEGLGLPARAAAAMASRAQIELSMNETTRAGDVVDDALLLLDDAGDDAEVEVSSDLLRVAAAVAARTWNHARSAAHLDRLLSILQRAGRPTADVRSKLAVSLAWSNDHARAEALLEEADEELDTLGSDVAPRVRASVAEDRVQVLRQTGRVREAAAAAENGLAFATAAGDRAMEVRLADAVADHLFSAWVGTWGDDDLDDDEYGEYGEYGEYDDAHDIDTSDEGVNDDQDLRSDDDASEVKDGYGSERAPKPLRDKGDPALRDEVITATRRVLDLDTGVDLLDPYRRTHLRTNLDQLTCADERAEPDGTAGPADGGT